MKKKKKEHLQSWFIGKEVPQANHAFNINMQISYACVEITM